MRLDGLGICPVLRFSGSDGVPCITHCPCVHTVPCSMPTVCCCGAPVYHVTKDGWKKVRGEDVGQLHYQYYPAPEAHPCAGTDPLA